MSERVIDSRIQISEIMSKRVIDPHIVWRITLVRIGIISDTHGLLRPEVLEALEGCNLILHGGDINRQKILDRLWDIAPVRVVRGNNDREWAEEIPMQLSFELGGIRVCMAHMKRDLPEDWQQHDLVIVGHTHRYEERRVGRTVLLNPGSCGPRRFHQEITMAVAEIEDGQLTITRIDIPHEQTERTGSVTDSVKGKGVAKGTANTTSIEEHMGGTGNVIGGRKGRSLRDEVKARISRVKSHGRNNSSSNAPSPDLKGQIEVIIAETQRKRTPEQIARKYSLDKDLVEQIVRLYLTHPGVTADGILTKMGY